MPEPSDAFKQQLKTAFDTLRVGQTFSFRRTFTDGDVAMFCGVTCAARPRELRRAAQTPLAQVYGEALAREHQYMTSASALSPRVSKHSAASAAISRSAGVSATTIIAAARRADGLSKWRITIRW